jgi:hypothetical protein
MGLGCVNACVEESSVVLYFLGTLVLSDRSFAQERQ